MESGQIVAGKYRLNQLLGSGGMAAVWSVTNVFTERQFAVKFMHKEVAKTSEAAARFMMEAKASARINHPNVIDIIDVGQTEDGTLFLVMELLTGVPLEVAMRRQMPPMTLYEFGLVMASIARALAAAHKNGVVHRDLKPSNIFLHKDREGIAVPKLLDFGVSKFLEDDMNSGLTVAGTVLGSPLYMSPEQARGDTSIDGRTDVFAFGAILFEGLTGCRAYQAKNFNALIVAIATTEPKSIDECAPEVPEALRAVVRACLETDREQRIGSFDAIAERLILALPELEQSQLSLPPPQTLLSTHDPDATNALPVVRASDRPPPMPALTPPQGTNSHPSTPPFSSPWQTPNPSYASVAVPAPKKNFVAMLLGAAGGFVFVGFVIGLAFAVRGRADTGRGAPALGGGVSIADSTLNAKGSRVVGSAEQDLHTQAPPVIDFDSLPVAARPGGALPKGTGRLLISAGPGWCAATVDGTPKGPTPLPALDLAPGTHHLRCEAPGGRAQTVNVVVADGVTTRYKFAFAD